MRVLLVLAVLVALVLAVCRGKRLKKIRRVAVILLVCVLGLWGAWWLAQFYVLVRAEREGRLFYLPAFALTTDPTPVEFTIRDRRFRVPKAYLEFKSEWTGGATDSLYLQALLPNMDPPSEKNLDEFKGIGMRNQILVTIENAEKWRELEDVDRWYLGEIVADTKVEIRGLGLVRYNFAMRLRREQLFIPLDRHPHIRYFTCDVEDKFIKFPNCGVFFYWDRKINIAYHFSKDYLPRWREVHDSVVHLVNASMIPSVE